MEKISPSDLIHLVVMYTATFCGGEQHLLNDHIYSLFCFLGKTITLSVSYQYSSIHEFLTRLQTFCSEQTIRESVIDGINSINSVDSLLTFMENCKTLFDPDTNISPNGLCGPNKICLNSTFGIFARKILAIWSTMLFDDQCKVYELFQDFVGDNYSDFDSFPASWKANNGNSNSLIRAIEGKVQAGDICAAKDLIHECFDVATGSNIVSGGDHVDAAYNELQNVNSLKRFGTGKYQYGMISLALVWIKVGNFPMAQAAVEEALKTAHQKGDHPTVVKCLVLLFEISRDSSGAVNLDLLKRCISKSAQLDLTEMLTLSTAALCREKLIAERKSRNNRNSGSEDFQRSEGWSLKGLLNLVAYCQHGETLHTVSYCLNRKELILDEPFPNNIGQPLPNQQKMTTSNENMPSFSSKNIQQMAQLASLQCTVWKEAGVSEVALFSCVRFLLYYGVFLDSEELFSFVCSLLSCQVTSESVFRIETEADRCLYYRKLMQQYYC